ncbi:NADH-quinone oxidoreductase subunit NuoH [Balneolaceae bacterium ANBcel3]|nr:NADH-quinone oxidoreductase subunit NuoH [Balneolaceae bacterium ANBcel3]
MQQFLESYLPAAPLVVLVYAMIPLMIILLYALFAIWFERKVAGHIQDRLGPMRVGGWHGWSQSIADLLKILQKEDIVPAKADRFLFKLAPFIAFAASYGAYAVIPLSSEYIGSMIDVGVFYFIAITSLLSISIIMAGWASNNKWSLLGAMRTAAQTVSYEVPTVVTILSVIVVTGTLNLMEVTEMQSGNTTLGFLPNWIIFHSPFMLLAFVLFFIAALAEAHRVPFDLPESESELVGGYQTEYSGMRWAVFMLTEYVDLLLLSLIGVVLFFGGWNSPFGSFMDGPVWGVFWSVSKAMVLVFVMMWLRWTLPRLRVDQLMNLCWKYLIPICFVNLILIALWEMLF